MRRLWVRLWTAARGSFVHFQVPLAYHFWTSSKTTNNCPYAFLGFVIWWRHMLVTSKIRLLCSPSSRSSLAYMRGYTYFANNDGRLSRKVMRTLYGCVEIVNVLPAVVSAPSILVKAAKSHYSFYAPLLRGWPPWLFIYLLFHIVLSFVSANQYTQENKYYQAGLLLYTCVSVWLALFQSWALARKQNSRIHI